MNDGKFARFENLGWRHTKRDEPEDGPEPEDYGSSPAEDPHSLAEDYPGERIDGPEPHYNQTLADTQKERR